MIPERIQESHESILQKAESFHEAVAQENAAADTVR